MNFVYGYGGSDKDMNIKNSVSKSYLQFGDVIQLVNSNLIALHI